MRTSTAPTPTSYPEALRKERTMKSYTVEFVTNAYVSIPVKANTLEEAQAIADKALTRYAVWAEVSDHMPADTAASIDGKGWELNDDIDPESD